MSQFDEIVVGYQLADKVILTELGGMTDRQPKESGTVEQVNDSAYFFMLFARFEHLVTEFALARAAVGRQSSVPADRRVWTVIDVRKMDFLRRLALLTDKGSPDYATVKELYEDRNAIAHGSLIETKPNVKVIAAKLSGILSRLEGTP